MINTPNRNKPNTKYIITAPYCHWIRERSITVLALLLYAICNTHLTRGIVKTAIKDAHTEEALCQRIAEQECYIKLVQTITTAITDFSEAENPSVGNENKIDEINGVIKFIREKRVKPSCKILSGDTVFSDFQTVAKDTTTMDLVRNIVNTKMSVDKNVKQRRNQHNNEIRSRNKSKQRELFKKGGENISHHLDTQKIQNQAQSSQWAPTLQQHQHTKRNSELLTMNQMCTTVHTPVITRYGADIPKEVLDSISTFDGKQGELNQFLSTIESYSTMYRIHKTDLVLLRSRGKVHEIIHHAIAEDADVEWSVIKKKTHKQLQINKKQN